MPYEYTPPDFLQGQSVDDIHERMMNALPDDIDKSELQIPWDFTRPAAIEKAELVEFVLNRAIQVMFPHWAWDEWLDLHAQAEGLARRPANRASGTVTVTGRIGTTLAQGFQFATPANLTPSVIFETTEAVLFDGTPDDSGQITMDIPIQAVEGGTNGNVPPDRIILMVRPETGITYVTNTDATSGGTPEESDDELRERILEAKRFGISYTGRDADYIRWAKEVSAVGSVVVDPEWNGPGTVRLWIADANGVPANQQIVDAVYNHIISPDDRIERLAPIGATLTVVAPVPLYITVSAQVTLRNGESLDTVTARFEANLNAYWSQAASENDIIEVQTGIAQNYVKYVFVGSVLAQTVGVANYTNLLVNGGTGDILISSGQYPVTQEVDLYE